MTKIESLELELAARKMVEGTELGWVEVLRTTHTKMCVSHTLPGAAADYELAIGIIEGKPVWEGDKHYDKDGNIYYAASSYTKGYLDTCSWNPPTPKTVKTVLVELTVEDAKWQAAAFNSPNPGSPSNIASACRKALEGLK